MARITYFDKYFGVLGLTHNAGDSDIKTAYRNLAKQYHPDRSGTESTRQLFIEVNEAYEILMNRHKYVEEARQRIREREGERRTQTPPSDIRERAASYADMKFEAFAKTRIYRTAMAMNRAFDVIFILVGVVMVLGPVVHYFGDLTKAAARGEDPEFHILPILFGISFLYGLWYFIYANRESK